MTTRLCTTCVQWLQTSEIDLDGGQPICPDCGDPVGVSIQGERPSRQHKVDKRRSEVWSELSKLTDRGELTGDEARKAFNDAVNDRLL